MKFEPEKFFIGLMDFFSILLPGALLTALLMDWAGPKVLGDDRYHGLVGAAGWAAFLFASYLLGHLVFLLGSWLDEFYDWARNRTLNKQIAMLAQRDHLLKWPARAVVWLVFKRERDLAVDRAVELKEKALEPLQAKDAINTFQWCKTLLNSKSPASLAVVQRFEADSKFFRCFTVVLLLLLVAWPFQHRWPPAGIPIMIALILLALWRYMEQRYKSTNQAYWSVITLLADDPKLAFKKPEPPPPGTPTHAGGVVYRHRGNTVEYLVVEAKKDPNEWVLPKGHIEAGEQPRETAIREVNEESGVWARIDADLELTSFLVDGKKKVVMQAFLMEAVGRGLSRERQRGNEWLSSDTPIDEKRIKARRKRMPEEALDLLARADELLKQRRASGKHDQPP
jgi:ADP-ribose pyrophosphatase YjhB (NUDIX family)